MLLKELWTPSETQRDRHEERRAAGQQMGRETVDRNDYEARPETNRNALNKKEMDAGVGRVIDHDADSATAIAMKNGDFKVVLEYTRADEGDFEDLAEDGGFVSFFSVVPTFAEGVTSTNPELKKCLAEAMESVAQLFEIEHMAVRADTPERKAVVQIMAEIASANGYGEYTKPSSDGKYVFLTA